MFIDTRGCLHFVAPQERNVKRITFRLATVCQKSYAKQSLSDDSFSHAFKAKRQEFET
jgi:hypothetical protein